MHGVVVLNNLEQLIGKNVLRYREEFLNLKNFLSFEAVLFIPN